MRQHALSVVCSVSVVFIRESWRRNHHFQMFPTPGELTAHQNLRAGILTHTESFVHTRPTAITRAGQRQLHTCLWKVCCPPGMAGLLCTQQFVFLAHQRVPPFQVWILVTRMSCLPGPGPAGPGHSSSAVGLSWGSKTGGSLCEWVGAGGPGSPLPRAKSGPCQTDRFSTWEIIMWKVNWGLYSLSLIQHEIKRA